MKPMLVVMAAGALAVSFSGAAEARPQHHPAATVATIGSSDADYTNVSGHRVHRPMHARVRPSGASAQCRDGSYSFSEHHRGACSHHGGVAAWYQDPEPPQVFSGRAPP